MLGSLEVAMCWWASGLLRSGMASGMGMSVGMMGAISFNGAFILAIAEGSGGDSADMVESACRPWQYRCM